MGEGEAEDARAAAFAVLFHDAYEDVLRFCARRVAGEQAEDIAAETMTVAWRRFDEMPAGRGDQRAWLFTTARNLLLHDHRDRLRRRSLGVRIAPGLRAHLPSAEAEAAARVDLSRAWRLLSERHQEALALDVWDGLTSAEAASVLGISPVAYRLRLSRARSILRSHLGVVTTRSSSAVRAQAVPPTSAPEATP